jgi:hypothetical protein
MVRTGALAVLVATTGITHASAQVRAAIQINTIPVAGTVVIGAAPRPFLSPVMVYPAPRHVVRRTGVPNALIVERVPHRGRGWWKRHGYRKAIVYMDGRYYYDGGCASRSGLTEVAVYARDGHYMMEAGGRYDRVERDD